jgi:succinyl-CoA synthetase alpha subunit
MTVIKSEVRKGVYYDSAFLMQLQRTLAELPEVEDTGVIMGTEANKELLEHINLVSPELESAKPDDLVIVVRAKNDKAALFAISQVDELLKKKKTASDSVFRPKSIESAAENLPEASWVLVSVAGRYADIVANDALDLGKHVFLFSDNVSAEAEIELKKKAAEKGLLVMGPDCGTAIVRGIGLGFANKVRLGQIGMVAAAGTGLQQVSSRIAQLGSGMTYGIGTGGRDLTEKVGAKTFSQGIDILSRDDETKVIVLVSKPPAPAVAEEVLKQARNAKKPVVVCFVGRTPTIPSEGNLFYAGSLDEAAEIAVDLTKDATGKSLQSSKKKIEFKVDVSKFAKDQKYFRGLFSGGTLAYEAQYILEDYLPKVLANSPLRKENKLQNSLTSQEHCIVDLGEDEFTVGRLHPMMDNELRIRRLLEEAADPSVAVIMLDVVIGYGSHMDPASELAPAVSKSFEIAKKAGRYLEIVAVVTGTDDDPQGLRNQIAQMEAAGTWVSTSNEEVVRYAGSIIKALNPNDKPSGHPAPKAISADDVVVTPKFAKSDLAMLRKDLEAINLGLESFAQNLTAQGIPVVHVDWKPPAGGNDVLIRTLSKMKAPSLAAKIEKANKEALDRMMEAHPVVTGVGMAKDLIPGMTSTMLLHAGPPITYERMAGPVKGAIWGCLMYEGLAKNVEEAQKLATSGKIQYDPCHHHSSVGPMAGLISPSFLVYEVVNTNGGNKAYSGLNEGRGKVLRMGAYSEEVLDRLHWMNEVMGPILDKAIKYLGGIDIRALLGKALHMGDDGHNRLDACSVLFTTILAPAVVKVCEDKEETEKIIKFLADNALSILNPVMAAAKTMADAAANVEYSTVVTTMARNGTDFGIRVSGLGDKWFTAPAPIVKALYFPGFSEKDANPDIGDSVITETAGFGGFAMASAPAIVTFISGTAKDAVSTTMDMYEITDAEHKFLTIPYLDFRGTPTGIDIRKVVDKGIAPRVNTGVAHKDPGVGQVGAGVVSAPMKIFEDAIVAFTEKYQSN